MNMTLVKLFIILYFILLFSDNFESSPEATLPDGRHAGNNWVKNSSDNHEISSLFLISKQYGIKHSLQWQFQQERFFD